jgi:hypothetical protein
VYVTGTFNDWKQKIRMMKDLDDSDFTTIIDFSAGLTMF